MAAPRKLIVLVDMDSVTCDFEGRFVTLFKEKYPHLEYIPEERRRGFYLMQQYGNQFGDKIKDYCRSIFEAPNFFRSLPPIPGAVEAILEMKRMDHVVPFLCTSPLKQYQNCVAEKFDWVVKHLGPDWTRRIILAADKTLAHGDILIDDRAHITGKNDARRSWQHVLFRAAQNSELEEDEPISYSDVLESWTDGQWRNTIQKHYARINKSS